jgi:hypothetical protein
MGKVSKYILIYYDWNNEFTIFHSEKNKISIKDNRVFLQEPMIIIELIRGN